MPQITRELIIFNVQTIINMRLPSKTIIVSAALIGVVVMSVAFSAPPERKYKNLKILSKNITEKELDSVMKTFTRGLGVKCNFCHASEKDNPQRMDFASDEKPEKGIARKMMKLTAKTNRKYFDYAKDEQGKSIQVVGCYTCHHGEVHPAKGPAPRQQQGPGGGQPQQQ